jgi:DNA-directed RNA polymerase sigma subunit (sigma70/sigma32)
VSLGRFEKRRHRRPAEEDEARRKLVAVIEAREYVRADKRVCRGKIDRSRGHVPTARWAAIAGAYIESEHYAYCVDYARGRGARHVPLDDMVQACRLGCFTALERFDLDHAEAYRFLSYAKWWMYFETQRVLHREEPLVHVDDRLRAAREKLSEECPSEVREALAAECYADLPDEVAESPAAVEALRKVAMASGPVNELGEPSDRFDRSGNRPVGRTKAERVKEAYALFGDELLND